MDLREEYSNNLFLKSVRVNYLLHVIHVVAEYSNNHADITNLMLLRGLSSQGFVLHKLRWFPLPRRVTSKNTDNSLQLRLSNTL